jgi:hypothetical protein
MLILLCLFSSIAFIICNDEVLNCTESFARDAIRDASVPNGRKYANHLLCAREHIQYSSTASTLLCHHFLKNDDLPSAYRYGLRALEIVPDDIDAIACLCTVYYNMGDFIRASFYSEVMYEASPTHYVALENIIDPMFIHMRNTFHSAVYPVSAVTVTCPMSSNLQIVCRLNRMFNGSVSVLDVYKSVQAELPASQRGSSVLAREEFLELATAALAAASHTDLLCMSDDTQDQATSVVPSITPLFGDFVDVADNENVCIKWPVHRAIAIYNDVQVYSTFGETAVGLSDALNKFGVPNSVLSTTETSEGTVLIKMVSGPTGNPQPAHYVVWNFEKGPTVAMPGAPFGFIHDQCGREEAGYLLFYLEQAHSFWDSIPSNMIKWAVAPENVTHKSHLPGQPTFVPGFVADNVLRFARLTQLFSGREA